MSVLRFAVELIVSRLIGWLLCPFRRSRKNEDGQKCPSEHGKNTD